MQRWKKKNLETPSEGRLLPGGDIQLGLWMLRSQPWGVSFTGRGNSECKGLEESAALTHSGESASSWSPERSGHPEDCGLEEAAFSEVKARVLADCGTK